MTSMRGSCGRALASAVLLVGGAAVAHADGLDGLPCELTEGPRRAVVGVVDAETIRLDDGASVRLIGALAPRHPSGDPGKGNWPPSRAATEAVKRLAVGKSVRLGFEKTRRDRYGRLLAQVLIEDESGGVWLQAAMVSQGHARAYSFADARGCVAALMQREAVARKAGLGIWANAAYAVRRAWRTRELMRFRHTFQIVEGEVRQVVKVGRRTFVNFGRRWQDDFTVVVEGGDHRAWEAEGQSLGALEGARVRVRGWIERWNGPLIRATHPEQIEVIGRE